MSVTRGSRSGNASSAIDAVLQARKERERALARERQRRRRANKSVRAREAAAACQRRQVNPELKAQKAQCMRQKRQSNPDLRQREAAAKRRRGEENPDLLAAEAEACRARRKERHLPDVGSDARIKRVFLDRRFDHSYQVCERLCFDKAFTKIRNIRSAQSRGYVMEALQQEFPATSRTDYKTLFLRWTLHCKHARSENACSPVRDNADAGPVKLYAPGKQRALGSAGKRTQN
ncbi:hypothetical protein HPB51_018721 [Rhipicephalus microplus]|uniref:Uncharacterized protein n=1 Tax=Rhipicephalus microplus TaxID=6941 RepID=A0A9J6DIY4_RHIMP|nr:hypothetical protein HPB51_018721 [Rhipicephalus microplus]